MVHSQSPASGSTPYHAKNHHASCAAPVLPRVGRLSSTSFSSQVYLGHLTVNLLKPTQRLNYANTRKYTPIKRHLGMWILLLRQTMPPYKYTRPCQAIPFPGRGSMCRNFFARPSRLRSRAGHLSLYSSPKNLFIYKMGWPASLPIQWKGQSVIGGNTVWRSLAASIYPKGLLWASEIILFGCFGPLKLKGGPDHIFL